MIDTVVLESPYISEKQAKAIEYLSTLRAGIDIQEGELLYKIITGNLKGTYDSSIRINLKRDKIESFYDTRHRKTYQKLVDTKPYIVIELSLHKFILGHNIYGGSDNLEIQVKHLIEFLNKQFEITLPDYKEFIVKRLDYARAFKLDKASIEVFFKGLNNANYPRRRSLKYDDSGIYFPGFTTTLKFYDKGIEFKKHDRKKLRKILSPKEVMLLEKKAENVLRIEIEMKAKKLKDIYNGKLPKVKEFNIYYAYEQWEVEVMRVLKTSQESRKLYNTIDEVQRILYTTYSDANTLLGTWYRLSTQGYDTVKKSMPKTTFYRHVSKLKQVGIVWNHTNIQVLPNNLKCYNFNPLYSDEEMLEDEIELKLAI